MPNQTILLPKSKILLIMVPDSAYDLGIANFNFNPMAANEINNHIEALTKDKILLSSVMFTITVTGWPNILRTIDYIKRAGLIHADDRPALGKVTQCAEEVSKQHDSLNSSLTLGQTEVFSFVARPWIEDILENAPNHDIAAKLFRLALIMEENTLEPKAKTALSDAKLDDKKLQSVVGSVVGLAKLCRGKANLETTFARMNAKLPDLKTQRLAIAKEAIALLKEKYSAFNDREKFCLILSILLFCHPEQTLNPLATCDEICNTAFTPADQKDLHEAFNINILMWHGNPGSLLDQTFQLMNIDIKKASDLPRITALQEQFKSIILREYIAKIGAVESEHIALLKTGLKQRDKSLIEKALSFMRDVNHPIDNNGNNILHAVVAVGDISLLETVLKFNPDLDRMISLTRSQNPLGMAIALFFEQAVQILLKHGANVFLFCSLNADVNNAVNKNKLLAYFKSLSISPEALFSDPQLLQQSMVQASIKTKIFEACLPITAVLTKRSGFNQLNSMHTAMSTSLGMSVGATATKTTPAAMNERTLKLLLEYGAGIGQHFDFAPDGLLPRIVMIGGSCHQTKAGTLVIITAAEFIKHIPHNEYPHWQRIFTQALESTDFKKTAALVAELTLLQQHITKIIGEEKIVVSVAKSTNTNAMHLSTATAATGTASSGSANAYRADGKQIPDTKVTVQFAAGSPITAIANDKHKLLLQKMQPILAKHPKDFKPLQDAIINEHNYGKALRRACTVVDDAFKSDAFELIKIICQFKMVTPNDIGQRVGEKNQNALHIAAEKGNQSVYDFLAHQQDVNTNLTDKSGKTALQILGEKLQQGSVPQPRVRCQCLIM